MRRTKTAQFTATAKWLHWIVAFLMISVISVALPFTFMDRADRAEAIPVHVSIGIIVVILTLARLGWRAITPQPPHPVGAPGWTRKGAKIGHWLLYALILWQGVLGLWLAASSSVDIRFFNSFNISALAPANPELVDMLRPWHRLGAFVFTAVLIGHVAAAFWHHFKIRDDVLIRMLPFGGLWQKLSGEGQSADWRMPTKNGFNWPKGKKENWLGRV